MATLRDRFAEASIFLLARQISATSSEPYRLLHRAYATASHFLVMQVGTEFALAKIKTNLRRLIVSVTDQAINFQ
jgi:hypothetical protein